MPSKTENEFRKQIRRCLLLNDAEKKFWLESAETLPPNLLAEMTDFFKSKNRLMESYVSAALKNDPKIIPNLKNRVSELKKHILTAKENESKQTDNTEEILKEINSL